MKFKKGKKEQIQTYLLQKIFFKDSKFKQKVVDTFNISISTVNRYLKELCDKNIIKKTENGYVLEEIIVSHIFKKEDLKDETYIFKNYFKEYLVGLKKNIYTIWEYGFTEMVNNVIDHSDCNECEIILIKNELLTIIYIIDDGIGILKKIKDHFNFDDIQEAAINLFKGKITTDPDRHSGEGIFFTSKALDRFELFTDNNLYKHSNCNDTIETVDETHILKKLKLDTGTIVAMCLYNNTDKNLRDIFDTYSSPDEGITKTIIPMRYLCETVYPISRSQAKRLIIGINKFKEVILDFSEVENIGQGFADELFRVFKNTNPDIKLIPENANEEILKMISHVQSSQI